MNHIFPSNLPSNCDTSSAILYLGGVSVGIDLAGLKAFSNGVDDILRQLADPNLDKLPGDPIANPILFKATRWATLAYIRDRDAYNLGYESVAWEVPSADVATALYEVKDYLRDITK